jgi:hypothetical protein
MAIEGQVNNISDLVPAYPQADDPVSQGDNHIRNIKKAIVETFPNIDDVVNASDEELNQLVGQDFAQDIADLDGRVTINEQNITINAGGIADNATDISSLEGRVDALENAGLTPHALNDHTDVDTAGSLEGYVLTFSGGKWVPMKIPYGGAMIKPATQPMDAGDFSYFSKEAAYFSGTVSAGNSATLTVPNGMVFAFEYLAAYGDCSINPDGGIYIDGIRMSGGSRYNGLLEYTNQGGPTWPGNEGFNPIRVESNITITMLSGSGQFYISGLFTPAD